MKQALIVSLHDLAPATRGAAEKILGELARHGVDVCSLLVIPNYRGAGASVEDREFIRWLHELETDGHEVVIHGYFHQRPAQGGETLRQRLMTGTYTANEGEFYDLGYDQAYERITRAREEFRGAGLKPSGFIAPAWLLSDAAQAAAADAEMEYTTRLTTIVDLRTKARFDARSLVYSTRSGWRRLASLGWNGALASLQTGSPLVRLAIHPPDLQHAEIWGQILRVVDRLAAERKPTTYRDWVAEQRANKQS